MNPFPPHELAAHIIAVIIIIVTEQTAQLICCFSHVRPPIVINRVSGNKHVVALKATIVSVDIDTLF